MKRPPLVSLALAAMLLAFSPAASFAQTGARLLLETFPKERTLETTTDANFMEGGHTTKNDEPFRLSVYESSGKVRLQPGVFESPRVGWNFTYLELHSTDDSLPEQLVDQSVGFAMPLGKWEDWVFALGVGVGYAGDTPFSDGDAWYGQGTLLALKEFNEESALIILLDYDGNRTFLPSVPLPGFAYGRRIRKDLYLTAGLPVTSLEWTPTDRLTIRGTYVLPDTLDLAVSYEVTRGVRFYGKTERRQEAFFLDGLDENYHRIIFEQKRAEVGVAWEPKEGFVLTVGVGYAWGGEFSTGYDIRDTDLVTEISDEPYLKAGLVMRF